MLFQLYILHIYIHVYTYFTALCVISYEHGQISTLSGNHHQALANRMQTHNALKSTGRHLNHLGATNTPT